MGRISPGELQIRRVATNSVLIPPANPLWRAGVQARDELRKVVGYSAADEIEKLDRLKKAGTITDAEFSRLRAKLVQ